MSEPKRPKCEKCGRASNVQAAPRAQTLPGTDYSQRWICGDCLYLEQNPETQRLSRERAPKVPQVETLL